MALEEMSKGEYRIPEKHFSGHFSKNPWHPCVFSRKLGRAKSIDDAVQMAKSQQAVLLNSQEFAAYLLAARAPETQGNRHEEYWLRTTAFYAEQNEIWQIALLDEAEADKCVVYTRSSELNIGQMRGYLVQPKRSSSLLECLRFRSSLEGRKMEHPHFSSIDIPMTDEQVARDVAGSTTEWKSLFGPLAIPFAKRVYRVRAQLGLPAVIRFEYPELSVLNRNAYDVPQGLRAVRMSALESPIFTIRFDGSFREEAAVITVRSPQDFYPIRDKQ